MRFYYSRWDRDWALSTVGGDGNIMRHESLGNSRNTISVKSRVGALEKTRFKRIKLDSILGEGKKKITPIPSQKKKL
jgi:hypothetical protein